MTFDLQTILIVAGVLLGVAILVWLLLGVARRRQSLEGQAQARVGTERQDPYAVTKERPYMAPPSTPVGDAGIDIAQPAIPIPGEVAGIAFPPHSTDHPDPLTRLKGVGPKLETLLNEHGITRYEQLASLDDPGLAALDERLGAFRGRLARDRVAEQARLLASGDTAAFEERFGKLGGN